MSTVRAMVPSGKSTGGAEAKELRDGDPNRYKGMGCLKAAENAQDILGKALIGMDPTNQKDIDEKLLSFDNSPNKDKAEVSVWVCVCGCVWRGGGRRENINAMTNTVM